MSIFKYQPYYQYDGPTLAKPFRREFDKNEVSENLELFFMRIEKCFNDIEAKLERLEENILQVTADISQEDCDGRVQQCLIEFEFYCRRVTAEDLLRDPNSTPS